MSKFVLSLMAAAALTAVPSFAADAGTHANTRHTQRMQWAPQTLSGTITLVDPAQKLVVVRTQAGVPFDVDITPHTRLENGNRRISLQTLNRDVSQQVQVKFIPERHGDVAAWIKVGQ